MGSAPQLLSRHGGDKRAGAGAARLCAGGPGNFGWDHGGHECWHQQAAKDAVLDGLRLAGRLRTLRTLSLSWEDVDRREESRNSKLQEWLEAQAAELASPALHIDCGGALLAALWQEHA